MDRCIARKLSHYLAPMILTAISAPAGAQEPPTPHQYVSPWRTPWTYEGPRGSEHWAQLDPQYSACAGMQQSPIDIRHTERADLPALQFEYRSTPVQYVTNNGATIRVDYDPAQQVDALVIGPTRYQLTQFHFHRPSEETINGKPYDMVLHLMHQSSDGKAIGVAVMLKAGKASPTIEELWAHMPSAEGDEKVAGLAINLAGLIPRTLGYYTYEGSQTAPPCHEGVTWIVLKTPMEISRAQIDAFARLYPHDVRPLQPLNGRVVKETR